MKYLSILILYIQGILYSLFLLIIPKKKVIKANSNGPSLIVSLTSYGRRVDQTVHLTLISLLFQSKKPDRIILWLDKNAWRESNLPNSLKRLLKYNIEIKYCDDIKSYKKLIPTLKEFPNDIIITVDDDVVYKRRIIEKLYCSYLNAPNRIHCTVAHKPILDNSGEVLPYRNWQHNILYPEKGIIFPVGVGGILYPPYTLHHDVLNRDLFLSLSPRADDIWFWCMALKAHSLHTLVDMRISYYPIDLWYQFFHKEAALSNDNLKEGNNDWQLSNLLKYYNLNMSDFNFINDCSF